MGITESDGREPIEPEYAKILGEEYVRKNSGFDSAVTGIAVKTKSIKLNKDHYDSLVNETAMLLGGGTTFQRTTIQHKLEIHALNARVKRISWTVK